LTHPVTSLPPGALDLTGPAVRRRRMLQRAFLEELDAAGYAEILPPTFEYEETFLQAGGPGVAERMIRFLDLDGRLLALRYDFTASVARVAATTFRDTSGPLRLSYSGKVFRQEPERGGRPREILQAGAELLGAADLAADLEILRLTVSLLQAGGVAEFQLNLGHAGILAPGLAAVDDSIRPAVRRWIDRKDRGSLQRALAGATAEACTLLTLPFVMGRRAALEVAVREAPAASRPGLQHLLALEQALSDNERVRGLDYYTGIHFEVFVAGAGRAVGNGGRYDGLMARFGRERPAVGVALDVDALAEIPQ
jgi:ATP phosphoribosyltransferase regulatory subunit